MNGLIEQWGVHTNSTTGATSGELVTLLISYSNTQYIIEYSYLRTDSGGEGFNHYNNITQSSFKIGHDSSTETRWLTIGY